MFKAFDFCVGEHGRILEAWKVAWACLDFGFYLRRCDDFLVDWNPMGLWLSLFDILIHFISSLWFFHVMKLSSGSSTWGGFDEDLGDGTFVSGILLFALQSLAVHAQRLGVRILQSAYRFPMTQCSIRWAALALIILNESRHRYLTSSCISCIT